MNAEALRRNMEAWAHPPDPIPPGYRVPADKMALYRRLKRELKAAGDDGTTRTMGVQRVYVAAIKKALQQQAAQAAQNPA